MFLLVLDFARQFIEYIDRKTKNNSCILPNVVSLQCCLWKFLNRNVYILTVIHATLISINAVLVVILSFVTDFTLLLGRPFGACGVTAASDHILLLIKEDMQSIDIPAIMVSVCS